PRRSAVAAHERTNEPPTQPAEIRPRGHKPNLVVHRLLVPSVVKPKPSALYVRQVGLVAYSCVRTVFPLVGPSPRPARPRRCGTRNLDLARALDAQRYAERSHRRAQCSSGRCPGRCRCTQEAWRPGPGDSDPRAAEPGDARELSQGRDREM